MTVKRTFTATKQLTGKPKKFRTWADYSVGDVIIAKYLGQTPNKFDENKPNHLVEVLESFLKDKKVQKEWIEGTNLILNHSGMMHKALVEVEKGTLIQITYNGTNTMEKGKYAGKEAHGIEILEIEEEIESDSDQMDL